MAKIHHYQILETVGENRYGILYRSIHRKEKNYVLIKMAKRYSNRRPFLHGFYTEQKMKHQGFLSYKTAELEDSVPLVLYDEQPIMTLTDYIKRETIDLLTALQISIELAILLSIVHEQRFIHNYLQPDNILINKKNRQVLLTGFEQATRLIRGGTEAEREKIDDHFISYLSPEQTGKINRPIDHRSDLYSLGCIMYELFTGQTPFGEGDTNEIIYAHLARPLKPPKNLRPMIPSVISNIIMKCLEKEPENRYQSSLGLKHDLEQCKRLLYDGLMDETFPLGTNDHSQFFEIPYSLYGRCEEINTIKETVQRVKQGHSEIMFVSGEPGIGKTALIHELYGEFVKAGGIFIEGKYDLLQRQDPYRPIVQAFSQLIKHLTAEGEKSIQFWRKTLTESLGENLPILTGLIPELQWLTGKVKKVREFSSIEEQRRFQITFLTFLNVIAENVRPIVLFLDDLQWADRASLDLLEYVFASDKSPYVFVIGAYRDKEVNTGHPLHYFLNRLTNHRRRLVNLILSPLSLSHTKQLIQKTLRCREEEGEILANFIYPLTEGNPLFIRQVLYSLYDDGFISTGKKGKSWEIHFHKVNELTIDEHIVSFILKKIDQLPKETIELLELASCFGNRFSLQDLVNITEINPMDISKQLWKALENGFVIPLDTDYTKIYIQKDEPLPVIRYRFSHDRIQQAVYSKMEKREKEETHFRIGNWLRSIGSMDMDNGSRFLEMVNHLNFSQTLLSEQDKFHLSLWNMAAGKRLQKSGAFEPALKYYNEALRLLPEEKWEKHHHIAYELTILTGESEFLNGNYKRAQSLFSEGIDRAKTPLEKLKIYIMQMNLFNYINRFDEALERGLKGLKLYRQRIPSQVSKGKLALEFLMIKILLWRKKTGKLLSLSEMDTEEKTFLLQTYILLNTPSFFVNQQLATFLMLRAVRLTLKHGNTEATSLVYNNYALILSAGFKDYKGSYEFGKLAIKHAEKYGNPNYLGRVYFVFGCFVNHWQGSLEENIRYLERSQSLSLESGNLTVAGSSSSFIIITYFLIGTNLSQLKKKVFQQLDFTKKIDYSLANEFFSEVLHWIEVLSHEDQTVHWDMPPKEKNDNVVIIMYYTIRLKALYLMGEMALSLKIMKEMEKMVNDQLTVVVIPAYTFYASLLKLKLWRKGEKENHWQRDVQNHLKKLKLWASHSPNNYEHQYLSVFGCLQLLQGKEKEGVYYIQRAIQFAAERGFVQDQAAINEWIGEYFYERGMDSLAEMYLREAEKSFRMWGAHAKADQLVKLYPNFSFKPFSTSEMNASFDLKTMIQATETLSKERTIDQLLKKYMEIILKIAGADLGYLIIFHREKGFVKVSGKIHEGIDVFKEGQPLQSNRLPMSVVHYVSTSQSEVYLDDAGKSDLFSKDPYIVQNGTKSLLCLPIILSGSLFGILYLENNLSANVQFLKHVTLLNTLSSQAAIFYINVQLYENLEKTVKERTKELAEMNRQLERKNNELAKTEQLQKELFSNISHDLKSPLSAIQGYIYAILDGYVEDREKEKIYLQKSIDRLEEMYRLIQDLFDLAKLQTGRIPFHYEPIGSLECCQRIYEKFRIDVTNQGLGFRKKVNPQILKENPTIYIDVKRMEQVFSNLISNAIQHTKEGEIRLNAFMKDEVLIISVQDTGQGINREDLPYVFDRFFTNSKKGHGIGLAVTKEIITNHGGEVWVESEFGKGSTFYISLPINSIESDDDPKIVEDRVKTPPIS
ncbi:ATP-binding sensor histidine kinase [Fervidibacillus halotolerans]|uniref:histidine kinase n=1 Tax=Fervidibacillus halotolerans TaxID=2980027 RepID=A0A9E8M2F5_9BACI|nr:ATP-binding sensor histidine kinase [Fervidibacillus halotolerans]WAA13316.1 trifunctional serine/threonine-protein kinase/ATP-binding protein/sensor histidine kinase [Fervidibacillus halotolerans]